MALKSLIINPGSTSTKVGIFEDETCVVDETLRHSTEEISKYDSIIAQKDFRKNIILEFLKNSNIDVNSFDKNEEEVSLLYLEGKGQIELSKYDS